MLSTKSFILSSVLILTGGFGSVATATTGVSTPDGILNSSMRQADTQQQIKDHTTTSACVRPWC